MKINTHVWIAENARKGFISSTDTSAAVLAQALQDVKPASCQEYRRIAPTEQKQDANLASHADARAQRTYVVLTSA